VIKILIVTSLILGTCIASSLAKHTANDGQYWNEIVLEHKLTDRITAAVKSEYIFINQYDIFSLYNVTLGAAYRFSDHYTLGAEYRYENEKDNRGIPFAGLTPICCGMNP